MQNYNCRVCGLFNDNPPWGEDGNSPTYEICPCCGVEFGYEDITIDSTKDYRNHWINEGVKWFSAKEKPLNWDMSEQFKNIPIEYV
jgi:hypothetical protein